MVKRAGKKAKRLKELSVDGTVVYGTVKSQSGYSEWTFRVDFNDYGHLTGRYWLPSDNNDSGIPSHIADNISSMIYLFPEEFGNNVSGYGNYANFYRTDEVEYDFNEE